jgi:hypothetical protein
MSPHSATEAEEHSETEGDIEFADFPLGTVWAPDSPADDCSDTKDKSQLGDFWNSQTLASLLNMTSCGQTEFACNLRCTKETIDFALGKSYLQMYRCSIYTSTAERLGLIEVANVRV